MQHSAKTDLICDRLPSQMLALEPRYLFDAAAAVTVADTTSDTASNDTGSADTSTATSSQDSTQNNAAEFLSQVSAASTDADLAPDNQRFAIPENTKEGIRAGTIATNPDAGEVTFLVTGGSGEEAFSVNRDTGTILVTDSSKLNYEDFEGPATLTLDVLITNGDTEEQEQVEVTIFLADIDEPPVVEPIEDQVAIVGETLTVEIDAYDEDGDQIFYLIKDAPEGASVDSDGFFKCPSCKESWTPTPIIENIGEEKMRHCFFYIPLYYAESIHHSL